MNIRRKLPAAVFLLVAVPLIFLSAVFYLYTSDKIKETSKEHIKTVAKLEGQSISTLIDSQKKEVELVSQLQELVNIISMHENGSIDNRTISSAQSFINQRLKKYPELQNIIVVDKMGSVIISGNENASNIDLSDREYFKAVMLGEIAVSNIITSRIDGARTIAIAAPIRKDSGEIAGALINTINMKYFGEYIKKIKIIDNGYAYLVDSNGYIIAHPNEERMGTFTENEALREVLSKYKDGQAPYNHGGQYKYEGKDKYMGYAILPEIDWVLVVTQDIASIYGDVYKIFYIVIVTALLVLLLAMYCGMNFSRSIIVPITKLTETMGKAANGDLSAKCEYNSQDEFGQLSQDFNIMLDKLNVSYEELTAVYEELTATEEELRAQYEELQENQEALRASEEKYRLALDGANDVIWEWDLLSNDFYASDKWTYLTGYEPINKFNWRHIIKTAILSEDTKKVLIDFRKHLEGKTDYYRSEFRIKNKHQGYKWVLTRGKILRNKNGKPIKIAGSLTDISDRKKAEEQITFMAYYDTLTKLPNRRFFIGKLKDTLKKSKQTSKFGALFFIDLDNFKNTNDTLGHEYGDILLQVISKRFKEVTGENDVVCRFGGDEFLILQPDISSEEDTIKLAKRILKIFDSFVQINDKQIYITSSIGIAIYPRDGEETGTLLKNADAAMYRAKEEGKNKFMFFNKDIHRDLERKIRIENVLRHAIDNNELQVFYQPQYNAVTKKICGFEALLRLNSKELGFIPPDEFIPIAEESGLITQIGEWCLRKACEDNKSWRDAGYEYDFVAVNISSVQLQQIGFVESVKEILNEVGLEPQFLEIEITETVLMKSLENNVKALSKLREMGVKIALDDFGTGYSSLNYLRTIPINILKIDKSFIDGICSSKKEEAVVVGIIQIAHNLSLSVVAEGVELEQQLELLKIHKCDRVQGYHLSRPVNEQSIVEMLKVSNL